MNLINKEAYQIVWKEFFFLGCDYKHVCSKTGLSFYQFKNVCKKLCCYNYSLVNNEFIKDFRKRYKINLFSRNKFDARGNRKTYQFVSFESDLETLQTKQTLLKRFNDVLKTEVKMIEAIKQDLKAGELYQKEIAEKHHVSQYFVLSCRTERKKRKRKRIPEPSQKRIMKELESWFTGRTITKKVEDDLKKLKILDLVLAGKIKEAKEKLQEDIEKENIELT